MDYRAAQFQQDLENHKRAKAYYQSIRRPWLERISFVLAFLASLAVSLRRLGWLVPADSAWLTVTYWICFFMFVGIDTIFAKAFHPLPSPFSELNPSRLFEKFSMQGRAWQLFIVLMLPITARLLQVILITRHFAR